MEANGIGSGIYTCINTSLLGIENNTLQQNPHNNLHHQPPPPQMVYSTHHDTESHPSQQQQQQQPQQAMKHGYPYSSKKPQSSTFSDEDEPGGGFGADESSGDPKRKASPWHRMKWTDAMVRLLIMAVYYIGDEAGSEGVGGGGGGGVDPSGKKKNTGLLQKKGKWKSVSRAMMEKGFYVSPQQCEDKFNDLNKRYKRVNDILGKGTACRVVENQSLLETMDLSLKMKEEVRKLLNSKHLFFREMCAYHNSCGHGGGAAAVTAAGNGQHSAEAGTEQPLQIQQPQPPQHQQGQQRCFHSSVNGVGMLKEDDDDEEDYESDDFSDEDEEESGEGGGSRGQVEDDENDVVRSRKRHRNKGGFCVTSSSTSASQLMQQLNNEVAGVLQDGGKNPWEKKQWMKKRVLQLEEQQVRYHVEAFELEKQRLKWVRFSSKKERDMERDKLENERRRLENERLLLLLRQKELEFTALHHLKHQQQQQHSST
ncbi:hypothetical protein HN51_015971 [Arachis hypogaea]|uniref:Myb/SANT-like DNA-binding domain-containing protein n=1 Tax=Arachis hypogaea TaxID=3818 RepID=A0A445CQT7_ARAHY|nr:uncharacterized protein LOC112696612 [Arachis hypogaea]QHO46453.1 uncharacterized protein DS421_6g187550 [Arachis hypogaea]QHO46454.1 uncharacterized protein DS421_6g187550 [Arachis hypogaea]QHO46455.1 uncharacterized protein DS421_6g187550 [Arachis hypogaea]RYR53302.1 hypothetical protein Ahy_A06g028323 [Arachis hypogaea]